MGKMYRVVEIVELVLVQCNLLDNQFQRMSKVQCNLVDNQYQQRFEVLYTLTPNKSYAYFSNVEPRNLLFLKTYNTEFDKTIIPFADQSGRA